MKMIICDNWISSGIRLQASALTNKKTLLLLADFYTWWAYMCMSGEISNQVSCDGYIYLQPS